MLTKDKMTVQYGNYRKYIQGSNVRLFQEGLMMLILIEDCDGGLVDELHIEWLDFESPLHFKDAILDLKINDAELTAQALISRVNEFSFHSLQLNGE